MEEIRAEAEAQMGRPLQEAELEIIRCMVRLGKTDDEILVMLSDEQPEPAPSEVHGYEASGPRDVRPLGSWPNV